MLAFFANILVPKKFQTQNTAFVIFGANILYEKRARKMLMKLTTVYAYIYRIAHFIFWIAYFDYYNQSKLFVNVL